MYSVKKVVLAILLSGSLAASAHASVFGFSFTGPIFGPALPVSGIGQFVTTGTGPNYTVTGVYGSIIDEDLTGGFPTPIPIIPGSISPYAGADNILYYPAQITGGNTTVDFVDFGGISFLTPDGAFNLGGYQTCCAAISVLNAQLINPVGYPAVPGSTAINLVVTPTDLTSPTPLPSTWTMLIAGFVGLGFLGYRRTKKDAAAPIAA